MKKNLRAHEGDHLFVTIEEVLGGWYALIRQARDDEQLVSAYRWLQQSVKFFSATRILSLESTTLARFRELRREHRRIGTKDLRIAAIVLEHNATLASRNLGDFGVHPRLSRGRLEPGCRIMLLRSVETVSVSPDARPDRAFRSNGSATEAR